MGMACMRGDRENQKGEKRNKKKKRERLVKEKGKEWDKKVVKTAKERDNAWSHRDQEGKAGGGGVVPSEATRFIRTNAL